MSGANQHQTICRSFRGFFPSHSLFALLTTSAKRPSRHHHPHHPISPLPNTRSDFLSTPTVLKYQVPFTMAVKPITGVRFYPTRERFFSQSAEMARFHAARTPATTVQGSRMPIEVVLERERNSRSSNGLTLPRAVACGGPGFGMRRCADVSRWRNDLGSRRHRAYWNP
jgi:hypothetical protein